MRTLTTASAVSTLCGLSIWLFAAPQLAGSEVVEPGPFFELMVVLPTPIGLIAAMVAMVAGVIVLVRRSARVWGATLVTTLGQAVTVVLAAAIVLWAMEFGSTGWELIALPVSLMVGQLVVGAGLVADAVVRRRRVRTSVSK
ncbi:hypothetical protein [Prescottella agglutinans]|uniref:hypothetical protein n=1 Tax=Prescottella agglutinans TaxID=1644129 RepID=UPI003D951ECF